MLVIVYWYENQLVLKTKYIYNVYFQYHFTLIGIIHVIKRFAVQIMGPTCSLTCRAYFPYSPWYQPETLISTRQVRCRAWYGSHGLIPGPIWKLSCNNLLLSCNKCHIYNVYISDGDSCSTWAPKRYRLGKLVNMWVYGRKELWTDKLRK
jgi:hypothetical protein